MSDSDSNSAENVDVQKHKKDVAEPKKKKTKSRKDSDSEGEKRIARKRTAAASSDDETTKKKSDVKKEDERKLSVADYSDDDETKKKERKPYERIRDESNNSRTDWWMLSQRTFHVLLTLCSVCSRRLFLDKKATEDMGDSGCRLHIQLCSACRARNKTIAASQRQPRKPTNAQSTSQE